MKTYRQGSWIQLSRTATATMLTVGVLSIVSALALGIAWGGG